MVPKKGGLGLGWLFQRGASPGKGSGKGWLGGWGGCKGFGCVVSNAYLKKKHGFF